MKIFGKENVVLLAVAGAILVIGYILLSKGPADNPLSLSWAPLLIVFAYCILIPYAIIKKSKNGESGDPSKK